MSRADPALSRMREAVALWYVGQRDAADLVLLACDLLVAGLDGPSLRMLAAVSLRHADEEVPDLLEPALRDVGLVLHRVDSPQAMEAALQVVAARVLSGVLSPREMTSWVHTTFGHDTLELAEPFTDLDDTYGMLEYLDRTNEEVDAEVRAEARRVLGI